MSPVNNHVPIQHLRGTAAALTSNNPTLAAGETAYETDTGKCKTGPGAWNSLTYDTDVTKLPATLAVKSSSSGDAGKAIDAYTGLPISVVVDSSGTPIDVDSTGVVDGNVPVYNAAAGKWKPGAGGTSYPIPPAIVGTVIDTSFPSGTTKTIAKPACAVGDDLYVAVSTSTTVATPTGWALVDSQTTGDSKLYVLTRRVDGTEPGTLSFTLGTANQTVAVAVALHGGSTSGLVIAHTQNATSNTGLSTSVTTTSAQSGLLAFQGSADGTGVNATWLTGWTELQDANADFGYRQVSCAYRFAPTVGAYTASFTSSPTAATTLIVLAITTTLSNPVTLPQIVATGIQPADILAAPNASPALTGTPSAPTPAPTDNSTKLANTAWSNVAIGQAIAAAGLAPATPTWARAGDPDVGGRVGKIHVSKYDSNRIFVPGDMLGLGLSTDGGVTYQPTFGLPTYEMGSVTEHPTNPLEKWAGTTGGPIKSVDGGKNWVVKRNGMGAASAYPATAPIEKIIFDPTDSTNLTMLAFFGSWRQWVTPGNPGSANYGRVCKSVDGGETWSLLSTIVTGGMIMWVTAAPSWTALFAAIWGSGIWKSTDKGATWTQLTASGSLAGTPNLAVSGLATADGTNIYASFAYGGSSGGLYQPGGVYKSTNGGTSWALAGTGQPQHADSTANNATSIFSITLTQDNVLYFTDKSWINEEKLYKSTDSGATWTNTTFAITGRFFLGPSGPWYITPDPNTAGTLWGGQDGIIRSTDAGASWQDRANNQSGGVATTGKGYSGILGTAVTFSKFQQGVLFTNGFDSGNLLRSSTGGQSWTHPTWSGWDYYDGGYDTVIGGSTGQVVYSLLGQAGVFNGVAVSLDAGATITRVATGGGNLPTRFSYWGGARNGLAIGSADGSVCYVVMGNYAYKTADFGATWTFLNTPSGMQMSDIAVTADFSTIYLTGPGWGVQRSTNGGSTWAGMSGAPSGGLWKILIGPDGSTLYGAGYSARQNSLTSGAWRWDGTQWTHLYGGTYAQFCSDIAVDPFNPNHFIIATDQNPFGDYCQAGGVLESKDGGGTWVQQNTGQPFKRVMSCAFDPFQKGRVIIGTDGAGFWTTNLNTSPPIDAASIAGVTVTGTPSAGKTIVTSSSTAASWQTPTASSSVGYVVPPSGDSTGATDLAAINAALGAHSEVWLNGYYYINGAIRPGSNNTLILADATVFLVAGSNTNMVLNADYLGTSGGNSNLRIRGIGTALFDQNASNQTYSTTTAAPATSWKGHCILLSHVSQYAVRDIQLQHVAYYGISPQQATDGFISNIDAGAPGPLYNAVMQTMGKITRLTIDGVRGNSEDDTVAMSTGDIYTAYYADQTLIGSSAGDVTDVTIRNIETYISGTNPGVHLVCINTGSGCKMQRVAIDNCRQRFPTTNRAQIGIGVGQYYSTQAGATDLSDITVTNTNARVIFSGSCANVKVSNVEIPNQAIGVDVAPILFTGGTGGMTYTNISISDVHYNGPSSTYPMVQFDTTSGYLWSAGAITVNGLKMTGLHSNGNLPTFLSNNGATITGLNVRGVEATSFNSGIFAAGNTGSIAGTMNDINVTTLPNPKWGSQVINVACGLNTPLWTSADPAPQGIEGAIVNADATRVLDSGAATPASYLYRGGSGTANTPALLTHTSAAYSGASTGCTTSGIDTTGATLIVVEMANGGSTGPTLTDSKGNTWTGVGGYTTGVGPLQTRLYYCANPIVGTGHTFSLSAVTNAYAALAVAAFSGSGTVLADVHTGGVSTSTTAVQPGSLTPTYSNELIVSGLVHGAAASASIDSGFTILEQIANGTGGAHESVALAYLIQTTAAAVNPTWSAAFGSTSEGTGMACFSFRSASAGSWYRLTNASPGGLSNVQTVRANAGAFTASQVRDVAITWSVAFADTNYTVTATLVDTANTANSPALRSIQVQTASGITVRIAAGSVGYTSGQLLIHAIAIHD